MKKEPQNKKIGRIGQIIRKTPHRGVRLSGMLAVFILTGLLCSCVSQSVNNKETGDITETEYKNVFKDGRYTVYESYPDEDGYAGVLCAVCRGGKLVGVNFDMVNKHSELKSEAKDDKDDAAEAEAAKLKSETKTLNTFFLQLQTSESLSKYQTGEYSRIYVQLAERLFPLMLEGKTGLSGADTLKTFTQTTEYAQNGYRFELSVTYYAESITSVSFSQKNESGVDILTDKEYISAFDSAAQANGTLNYSELMSFFTIKNADDTLKKTELPAGGEETGKVYNALAARIEKMHSAFECDVWLL